MKSKKNFVQIMRSLHRDIGYFTLGLVILYAISGIVLTYRGEDKFKHDKKVEKQLEPGLESEQLGRQLWIRDFKVLKTEGDIVYFEAGTYNSSTGFANYTVREVISPINKFIELHKSESRSPKHYVNIILGICLLFLAISSFWMYKRGSRQFKRALIISGTGIIIAIVLTLF